MWSQWDIYLYMNDYCCCWQCIQKDKNRSLHQEKHDNDAHSSKRHISRYLTNAETRLLFLWHQMLLSVLGTSCVTILTAIVPSSGVSFIFSLRTVSCSITQLIHGDTQARGWTGPLSWVTLTQYIIWRPDRCIIFMCEILCINKRNQDCQKLKDLLSELRTGSLIPTRKWRWFFTKLWLGLSCQGHYCHFKSMLESWALRGVIWGLRGFLQPIL